MSDAIKILTRLKEGEDLYVLMSGCTRNPYVECDPETFDDYAYSVGDSTFSDGVKDLDLAALLDDFVVAEPRKGVALRMRKL